MSKYTVDPELLADLDGERSYASSHDNSPRRLKLGKGERALVRVLPVNLMPDQPERRQWFARVGFHWHDKRFVICPRTTQPLFGGDPEAKCPVCDVADKYVGHKDESIRKKASMASSFPNWLVYLLLWEFYKKGDDQPTFTSKQDQFVPHSFWLKRPNWLDMSDTFKKSLKRIPDFGILNPLEGYDLTFKKDDRGNMTLSREFDPAPISKSLASYEDGMAYVDEIFSKVKSERLNPSSDKELKEFARKLLDSMEYGDGGGRSRGRVDEDENLDLDTTERRSSRSRDEEDPAPVSRRRADPDEDPVREEAPARRSAPVQEEAPARRSAPREETRERDPEPRRATREEAPPERRSVVERELDAEEPPPAARVSPAPASRVTPPPASRVTPPPAARTAVRPPPEDNSNEDDGVAPERTDLAPPADPDAEDIAAEPAKPAAVAAKPLGRLSDSLRNNIAALDRRR